MKFDSIVINPADVVAVLMIIGLLFLKFQGIDHVVDTILLTIAAFYFGSRIKNFKKE